LEKLISLAGILAIIRAYWVNNLLRNEMGEKNNSFLNFLKDKNIFSYYLLIRPFHRKMKNRTLKVKINAITYLIYIILVIGLYFIPRV